MENLMIDAEVPEHVKSLTLTIRSDEDLPKEILDWLFQVSAQAMIAGFMVEIKFNNIPMDVDLSHQTGGNA